MSEVLVGSAYALMQLRYEQFTQGVSVVEQQIARLQALSKTPIVVQAQIAAPGSGSGAAPLAPRAPSGGGAAEFDRLQRAQAALEAQQARLARVQGDGARAAQLEAQAQQRLTDVIQAQSGVTVQSIATERQLATVQQQSARAAVGGFGTQVLDQFKNGLIGIIGPAALVATSMAAAKRAVDSFKDAFDFKARLDATNLAIRTNLDGVRDQGQVYAQAAQFAARYRLTQQETADILASSTDILRVSTASVGALESALLRLQSRDVSKPVSEAARAVRELNSGDVTSIKELFNVPAKDALQMKNEIAGGADAVQVLTSYLDRAGVGMGVLENRAKGAAGAINEQRIAAEKLALAQAKFAEGPGVAFTQFKTNALQEITAILSGDFTEIKARNAARIEGQKAYNAAIEQGKSDAEAMAIAQQVMANAERDAAVAAAGASVAHDRLKDDTIALATATRLSADALGAEALKKLDSTIASAQLSQQQAQLDADSRRAAVGLLGAGDQALILAQKYGIAADQAAFLIRQQQALSNATALADQRVGERDPSNTRTAAEFNKFDKLADAGRAAQAQADKAQADKAAAEATQLQSARDNLALSRATTSAQRIAVLRQQQARATTEAEKIQLQAQIEQAQRAGSGRVSAAQTTAQQLNTVEQNSGLQLAKTQRENLERLRDQQEDFDVKRSRRQEDFEAERRRLLAQGQKGQAARLSETFARDQGREQEDFDRQKRRTLRNNQEGVGDIDARTDLRSQQIADRARLRGVRTAAANVDLGQAPPTLGGATAGGGERVIIIRTEIAPTSVQIDGKQIVDITWPDIEQRVDTSLADSIAAVSAPGSGQPALG